jgi:hypothetical protein
MKTLHLLLFVLLPSSLLAQIYNPYVSNGSIAPAPMAFAQDNGSAIFSFDFGNTGTSALPYVPGQEMQISISLLRGIPNPAMTNLGVTGSMQSYFTWVYDAFANSVIGIQNQPIPANASGVINLDYKATSNSTTAAQTNGFNVNLVPAPTAVGINNVGDDNTSGFTYTIAIGLGVDLINFSGQKYAGYNLLNWSTAAETNSSHFNLYYGVEDNKMDKLARIESKAKKGESSSELNYGFKHYEPVIGNNFYRLVSVDVEGKEDFHNSINIYIDQKSTLNIAPNPTKDGIHVNYQNGELDMLEFTLADMQGKIVYKKRIVFENGTFSEWIPMKSFAKGTYLLNLTDFEGYSFSQKVVKD